MSQSPAQTTPQVHTNGSSQAAPTPAPQAEASVAEIERIFKLQQENQYAVANTTARERKAKLKKLHKAVLDRRKDLQQALYDDFQKHPAEVDLTEIYAVTNEIKHTVRHLSKWMKPKKVATPVAMLGTKSWIHYEPKGVCLLISPWNFPVNLTFGPLVAAIASGNTVMIKPSEMTPHTSRVMKSMVDELFDESEIALIEGGIATSTALLALPFNHIFFTGAPSIGKIVMEAAAKHLASVTLELGGKSPTIVDETANLDHAASRVAWGKYANNGQICIAPDYLYVHESKKDEFIKKFQENITTLYEGNPRRSESYARIVNNRHFQRVNSYLEDAAEKGATIVHGGATESANDFIEPTVVTDLHPTSKLMTEEIFGPVLPVITFKSLDEPLAMINSKEKPLALYIYSKSNRNIDYVIQNTRAGGTVINHNMIQFFNNNLPFGGSNNSGIGKGHGEFGFQAFSNARGVVKQVSPFNALQLMTAPYTKFKQTLIDLSIKYF